MQLELESLETRLLEVKFSLVRIVLPLGQVCGEKPLILQLEALNNHIGGQAYQNEHDAQKDNGDLSHVAGKEIINKLADVAVDDPPLLGRTHRRAGAVRDVDAPAVGLDEPASHDLRQAPRAHRLAAAAWPTPHPQPGNQCAPSPPPP